MKLCVKSYSSKPNLSKANPSQPNPSNATETEFDVAGDTKFPFEVVIFFAVLAVFILCGLSGKLFKWRGRRRTDKAYAVEELVDDDAEQTARKMDRRHPYEDLGNGDTRLRVDEAHTKTKVLPLKAAAEPYEVAPTTQEQAHQGVESHHPLYEDLVNANIHLPVDEVYARMKKLRPL